MKVILIDRINKLGNLGDQIQVKSGYARNFLLPTGKAVLSTKKNIKYFNNKRTEIETKLSTAKYLAEQRAKKIKDLKSITIFAKCSKTGKLFGSVRANDISKKIAQYGIKIVKNEIKLKQGFIRYIGSYKISIRLHSTISIVLNVIISPIKEMNV